jgi:hypothetical protein
MQPDRLFVYRHSPASPADFVAYWEPLYGKKDKELDDRLYTPNINGPHTHDTLKELFQWKIGRRFFDTHWPNIERDFIARMDAVRQLRDITPDFFPEQDVPRWRRDLSDFLATLLVPRAVCHL